MTRRIIAVLLAMTMLFCLAACGGSKEAVQAETTPEAAAEPAENAENVEEAEVEPTAEPVVETVSDSVEFTCTIKGTPYTTDMDEGTLIDILDQNGYGITMISDKVTFLENEDGELVTIMNSSKDFNLVTSVVTDGSCIELGNGISAGSTHDEIIAAYGEDYEESESGDYTSLIYRDLFVNAVLMFYLKDNAVEQYGFNVKKIVKNMEVPEGTPDEYVITIDGATYVFPIDCSYLAANGWYSIWDDLEVCGIGIFNVSPRELMESQVSAAISNETALPFEESTMSGINIFDKGDVPVTYMGLTTNQSTEADFLALFPDAEKPDFPANDYYDYEYFVSGDDYFLDFFFKDDIFNGIGITLCG